MQTAVRLTLLSTLAALAATAFEVNPDLDAGYRQMYNLEFDQAHRTFARCMRNKPGNPLPLASDAAAYLFAELDRLHVLQSDFFTHDEYFVSRNHLKPDPALQQAFLGQLAQADALAERALARNPRDTNALFARLLASGLRSNYEGLIEKHYLSSLSDSKAGRNTAETLLAIDPSFNDAWLAIGVENYLLSLKPAPVRWFLRLCGNQTDRAAGLEKLRRTAEQGHYLQPFARLLLAVAALRDNKTEQARSLLRGLKEEFPQNHLYAEELSRLQ